MNLTCSTNSTILVWNVEVPGSVMELAHTFEFDSSITQTVELNVFTFSKRIVNTSLIESVVLSENVTVALNGTIIRCIERTSGFDEIGLTTLTTRVNVIGNKSKLIHCYSIPILCNI